MNIRAVLFDGYGTLFSGGMDKLYKVCEKICDDHGVDLDGRGFLGKWDKYFFPLIRNGAFIPFREAHYRSLTAVFGELGINAKPNGYVERIFELLGQVDLYDDVKPALGKLDGELRLTVFPSLEAAVYQCSDGLAAGEDNIAIEELLPLNPFLNVQ